MVGGDDQWTFWRTQFPPIDLQSMEKIEIGAGKIAPNGICEWTWFESHVKILALIEDVCRLKMVPVRN